MITATVVTMILSIVVLIFVWIFSPAFRAWTEKPKYTMLERNEMFERQLDRESNDHADNHR
jgi:hypothetical protein